MTPITYRSTPRCTNPDIRGWWALRCWRCTNCRRRERTERGPADGRLVAWGARRGDIQIGSREDRARCQVNFHHVVEFFNQLFTADHRALVFDDAHANLVRALYEGRS